MRQFEGKWSVHHANSFLEYYRVINNKLLYLSGNIFRNILDGIYTSIYRLCEYKCLRFYMDLGYIYLQIQTKQVIIISYQ